AQLEADRKKNLERLLGQAGSSGDSNGSSTGVAGAKGGANAKGTAQQSSGPSAAYAGKLVARIRPNIVFTGSASGNPRAEVEVRTLPDGTIVGKKLVKSSGNPAWDEAVLRAIDRTNSLPRDENGKVPPTLLLEFRPQD
nr:TonB C-terminal domain-containing protein [Xylophilus sp.]